MCPAGRNLGFCFRFSALTRSEMVSENVENLIYEAGNVKKKKSPAARSPKTTYNVQTIINPPNTHFGVIFHFTPLVPILPPGFFGMYFTPSVLPPWFKLKKTLC